MQNKTLKKRYIGANYHSRKNHRTYKIEEDPSKYDLYKSFNLDIWDESTNYNVKDALEMMKDMEQPQAKEFAKNDERSTIINYIEDDTTTEGDAEED